MSYQLFDPLDEATEAALRESIKRFGVIVPVVKDQHGEVIDGHHRERIATEEGVPFETQTVTVKSPEEGEELAASLNTDRRHLDPTQRREIVAHLRSKGHSVRSISKATGSPKSTVQDDITQLSGSGQLEQPETITGEDGKTRPATRPKLVNADTGEVVDPEADLAEYIDDEEHRARLRGQELSACLLRLAKAITDLDAIEPDVWTPTDLTNTNGHANDLLTMVRRVKSARTKLRSVQ